MPRFHRPSLCFVSHLKGHRDSLSARDRPAKCARSYSSDFAIPTYPLNPDLTRGFVPPAFRHCSTARVSASVAERLPRATPIIQPCPVGWRAAAIAQYPVRSVDAMIRTFAPHLWRAIASAFSLATSRGCPPEAKISLLGPSATAAPRRAGPEGARASAKGPGAEAHRCSRAPRVSRLRVLLR